MTPPLDGKVAVITGAGRGIGAATARRLAADGAAVAVLDLTEDATTDTVAAIESAGGRALGIGCDVVDAQQVHVFEPGRRRPKRTPRPGWRRGL